MSSLCAVTLSAERSPQELPATELAANCRRDFLNGGFRCKGTAVFPLVTARQLAG